ncbi:unnamed protein product [Nezara viridula]|uniref:Uncharacterized protein n=1 Tax=Nezara viridula TaxID=85310 RepID=A0A9P0HPU9_NEZVI|nr:unnamed protein product [Nezara viridula]
MITVTPAPGKYAQFRDHGLLVNSAPTGTMGTDQQLERTRFARDASRVGRRNAADTSWAERHGGHHYQRLHPSHGWDQFREGQPDRSAMEEPHPGGTAFMITVTPTPGKYAQFRDHGLLVNSAPTGTMGTDQHL